MNSISESDLRLQANPPTTRLATYVSFACAIAFPIASLVTLLWPYPMAEQARYGFPILGAIFTVLWIMTAIDGLKADRKRAKDWDAGFAAAAAFDSARDIEMDQQDGHRARVAVDPQWLALKTKDAALYAELTRYRRWGIDDGRPQYTFKVTRYSPYNSPKARYVLVEATTYDGAERLAQELPAERWITDEKESWNMDWGTTRVRRLAPGSDTSNPALFSYSGDSDGGSSAAGACAGAI